MSSTFTFGANSTANAPSTSLFGGNKAPSTGFGATPGFSGGFGSSAFGAAPTTTFGTAAPAPTTAFGSQAPTSTFGAPSFGAPAPNFGAPAPTAAAPQALAPSIAGHMLYEELPKEYQQHIDSLYEKIRDHQRTMELIQTTDMKTQDLHCLRTSIGQLERTILHLHDGVSELYENAQHGAISAVSNCQWALEAAAAHRGLVVPHNNNNQQTVSDPTNEIQAKLRSALTSSLGFVDRLERMPPYIVWECIQDCEKRVETARFEIDSLHHNATVMRQWFKKDSPFETHRWNSQSLEHVVQQLHQRTIKIRKLYNAYETGENVLEHDKIQTMEKEQHLQAKVKAQFLQVAAPPSNAPAFGAPGPAPAFGAPAQAPAFGAPGPAPAFGSSAPAPAFGAPAPGPAFGASAPAPAFGAPGPAPAFGSPGPAPAFGASAPAPAFGAPGPAPAFGAPGPAPAFGAPGPAPAFGSSAPAPAFGAPGPAPAFGAPGPAFGSTAAPAPFGSTAQTPAFGTTPAPTTGFSFGSK